MSPLAAQTSVSALPIDTPPPNLSDNALTATGENPRPNMTWTADSIDMQRPPSSFANTIVAPVAAHTETALMVVRNIANTDAAAATPGIIGTMLIGTARMPSPLHAKVVLR